MAFQSGHALQIDDLATPCQSGAPTSTMTISPTRTPPPREVRRACYLLLGSFIVGLLVAPGLLHGEPGAIDASLAIALSVVTAAMIWLLVKIRAETTQTVRLPILRGRTRSRCCLYQVHRTGHCHRLPRETARQHGPRAIHPQSLEHRSPVDGTGIRHERSSANSGESLTPGRD